MSSPFARHSIPFTHRSTRHAHAARRLPQSPCPSLARRNTLFVLVNGLVAAFSAQAADESASPRSATELDRITVTAQKKEESEIDVPVSMTVLGPEEIEALRVTSLDNFILTIPNATFTKYGIFDPIVSLRGVSSMIGGQFDPIGVTVDDVSYGTTENEVINSARFFDIERIEVLRGPQGTLTGSNSLGGSINYISYKPDPEAFELKGMLDIGRYGTRLARVVMNTPLADNLALRTVAYTETSDGAVKNIGPGGGDSGYDNGGGRAAVRWLPTDRLTIDASYAYERQRTGIDSRMYIDRMYDDPDGSQAREFAALLEADFDDPRLGFIEDVGVNGGRVSYDTPERHTVTNKLASLRIGYAFDHYNVDLIYGYFDHVHTALVDSDASEYAIFRSAYNRYDTSNSVELRVASKYDGPLNWIGGLAWHDESNPYDSRVELGDDALTYLSGGTDYVPGGSYYFYYNWGNRQDLITKAVFANLTWDITPRLHWSLGARFTRSTSRYGETYEDSGEDAPLPPIGLTTAKLDKFTPRTTLNFDLNDDLTVYAQYATGFRNGYGNGLAGGLHETNRGTITVPADVQPEEATNYELGLKGLFLQNRLSLNLAAFYMDYTDLQVYGGWVTDLPDEPGFDVNAGKASMRGAELELAWRPLAGLNLRAGLGYVDSNIKELTYYNGGVYHDIDMPGVRPWTMNLTAAYERPVGGDLWANWRIDYTAQARSYDDTIARDRSSESPRFHTVNLSTGVRSLDWDLTVYIDNLFDETYWLSISTPDYPVHGSRAYFNPRTWGIRFNYRFGGN